MQSEKFSQTYVEMCTSYFLMIQLGLEFGLRRRWHLSERLKGSNRMVAVGSLNPHPESPPVDGAEGRVVAGGCSPTHKRPGHACDVETRASCPVRRARNLALRMRAFGRGCHAGGNGGMTGSRPGSAPRSRVDLHRHPRRRGRLLSTGPGAPTGPVSYRVW